AWQVLPAIVLAFAGLAMAMQFISDAYLASIAVGAFVVTTAGLLLVPAVSLRGTLDLTHDGITFVRGKEHLTAAWNQVLGVVSRPGAGLSVVIRDPQQTTESITMPGGFASRDEEANIPLRLFGDRRFSILYDVRDRLPENVWRPAAERAGARSRLRIRADYALATAVSIGACVTAWYVVTH
ncbi:MAG: hypothetical protein JOZ46_06215, partial [Candidatus Dormibacteraeota bacterium]|nr:hypothetical protein [Candidatus Dormibacteraeota bacterium]